MLEDCFELRERSRFSFSDNPQTTLSCMVEIKEIPSVAEMIGDNVRKLMVSRNIPKVEHSKTLAEILELSTPQAYKYLGGRSELSVTQLRKVAQYFGVPLAQLVGDESLSSTDSSRTTGYEGVFEVCGRSIACRVSLGQRLESATGREWVAFNPGDLWHIVDANHVPTDAQIFAVSELEIICNQGPTYSVAVLDDSKEMADSICACLAMSGFKPIAFYDSPSILASLATEQYDCFILDWVLRSETSESVIHRIRESSSASSPIFLLTGELGSGRADKKDIARAIEHYHLVAKTKPIYPDLLIAEMYTYLGKTN